LSLKINSLLKSELKTIGSSESPDIEQVVQEADASAKGKAWIEPLEPS
jgi:hypothetical protein